MKKYLAFSSHTYLIKTENILQLPKLKEVQSGDIVILLNPNGQDFLYAGQDILEQARQRKIPYVRARFCYYTWHPIVGLFLQSIKYIKRRSAIQGQSIYQTKVSDIARLRILRGIRTRNNAYDWTNPKWKLTPEQRKQRYNQLYLSLSKNGYDINSPLLIGINRKNGINDQLLQGHHRIGICQELNIENVSISFWAYPVSIFHKKQI